MERTARTADPTRKIHVVYGHRKLRQSKQSRAVEMTLSTDTGGAETAWPLPHSHRPDDGYMYVMTEIHKARAGRDLIGGAPVVFVFQAARSR